MSIEIQGINKFFDKFQALHDINLTIPDGQLTALLGPSGSGKTTLLRIIAGLETPEEGRIRFSGRDVTDLHVRDRRVGFVFQHYALFRHMTVAENVAFGLNVLPRKERPGKPEIRKRVKDLLEMVARSSALRWLVPWPCGQRFFCWMNPSARLMPRCEKTYAAGCEVCTTSCTSPVCS